MHGGEGVGCALEWEPEDPARLAALALSVCLQASVSPSEK